MSGLLIALIALMIVGALIAIEARNLLSAIICVGSVGFLAAIAFVLLGAPDLAIAQVAVEILGLVILIPATIRRDRADAGGRRPLLPTLAALVAVLLGTAASWRLLAGMPAFGVPVMDRFADAPSRWFLGEGLAETGAPNIVTAILLDYRAYDTLGEASVLFCAILGVAAILRGSAGRSETGDAP
ncbi:MAG: hydrogen gas-evolving membrane-bound hydrogenase subunit E [Myxococcota bacterium]